MIPAALLGPAAGAVLLALAAAAGFAWLRLEHDPAIRAEEQAKVAAVTAAALAADRVRSDAALAVLEDEREALRLSVATTRERIIRVPVTTACAASPAVRSALSSLRQPDPGGGAHPGAAAPAGVPGRAGAAR